jgi:hypothetical protein
MFLLDNGILGFALIMPLTVSLLLIGFRLFLNKENPLYQSIGGACLAAMLALGVASMGSQTFYPRVGLVMMWALIGIMLRAWVMAQNSANEPHPGNSSHQSLDTALAQSTSN